MRTRAHTEGNPEARGSWSLLRDPVVGPFLLGKLLSMTGMWAHNITAAIVVFQLTGSATLVGAVSIAQFLPQFALSPWSGARADRAERRRQLVVGRIITAAGSGALALWIATAGLSGGLGASVVIAAGLMVGVGFAVGGPALEALLPSMVRPSELGTLVSLNILPPTLGRTLGPALGGLLATAGGPTVAFAVAAAGHLLFAVIVAAVVRDAPRVPPTDTSMRSGLRRVRKDPALAALLVGTAAVGVGADPAMTLSPSIAESFGGGSQLVGALSSAFGVGAAAAFLVLTPCRRAIGLGRMAPGGLLLLAAGLAGLALSGQPLTALLCFAIAGVGMTMSLSALTILIQHRSPDSIRGRIMALWAMAFMGARPVAAPVNGVVADTLSTSAALVGAAVVLLVCAWVARPSRTEPSTGIPASAGDREAPWGEVAGR